MNDDLYRSKRKIYNQRKTLITAVNGNLDNSYFHGKFCANESNYKKINLFNTGLIFILNEKLLVGY